MVGSEWVPDMVKVHLATLQFDDNLKKQPELFMSDTASDPVTDKDSAASKFESGKAHAKQAAEELRAAAEVKAAQLRAAAEDKATQLREAAEAKAQEFKGRAEEAYTTARTRARSLQEEGETFVRQNPLRGVLTALGVGFVLGLLFRR